MTETPHFKLPFHPSRIAHWSDRYEYADKEPWLEEISRDVRARGYYRRKDFLHVCAWKSSRTRPLCEQNLPGTIEETTRIALSSSEERIRIGVLSLLSGVSLPTASTLLHFGHDDPYPILDYRALWSLGHPSPPPSYSFDFWWSYTRFCRRLARRARVTIRTLDRALWQYSKERQGA